MEIIKSKRKLSVEGLKPTKLRIQLQLLTYSPDYQRDVIIKSANLMFKVGENEQLNLEELKEKIKQKLII